MMKNVLTHYFQLDFFIMFRSQKPKWLKLIKKLPETFTLFKNRFFEILKLLISE